MPCASTVFSSCRGVPEPGGNVSDRPMWLDTEVLGDAGGLLAGEDEADAKMRMFSRWICKCSWARGVVLHVMARRVTPGVGCM